MKKVSLEDVHYRDHLDTFIDVTPEGPGFESRSSCIAQARVRLANDILLQTPHRAGAFCTGYVLLYIFSSEVGIK